MCTNYYLVHPSNYLVGTNPILHTCYYLHNVLCAQVKEVSSFGGLLVLSNTHIYGVKTNMEGQILTVKI